MYSMPFIDGGVASGLHHHHIMVWFLVGILDLKEVLNVKFRRWSYNRLLGICGLQEIIHFGNSLIVGLSSMQLFGVLIAGLVLGGA